MNQPLKKDVILSGKDYYALGKLIDKAVELGKKAKPFDRATIPDGEEHIVISFGNYFYHKEDE